MLPFGFDDLVTGKHRFDFLFGQEIIHRRIFFIEFDVDPGNLLQAVHPGGFAVEVGDDRPPARLEHPADLAQRPGGVAGGMHNAVGPDRIEGIIREAEIEHRLHPHIFRLHVFQLEMPPGHLHCVGGEIGGGDPHPALEEFQAVIAHPAADLQEVLSPQKPRFAVDARHDPGKLIGIHPLADMVEKFPAPRRQAAIGGVLQSQGMGVPVVIYRRQGGIFRPVLRCIDFTAHEWVSLLVVGLDLVI